MCHLDKAEAFNELCRHLEMSVEGLQFDRLEVTGEETVLRPATGGMKVFWIYSGEGDVFLPAGHRTKEGDGHALPPEYRAEAMDAALAERLALLERALSTVRAEAQSPVQAILARRRDGAYVGDFANDLWKLEHAPRPWSDDEEVDGAISFLFGVYRECGHSVKNSSSYERVMAGDQLVVAGDEYLRVRGRFSCVTVEQAGRVESHVPAVMRLRYLRDSSGGCNFDFDPFRRLPLTWYMNLPGEDRRRAEFRQQPRGQHREGNIADPFPPCSGDWRRPRATRDLPCIGSGDLRTEHVRPSSTPRRVPGSPRSAPVRDI